MSGRLRLGRVLGPSTAALALLALAAAPASAPVEVPRIVDISDDSGIAFRHVSGDPEVKDYIFETKGGGIGALDYDGDGWQDIYVVQGCTVELWRKRECPSGRLFRNLGGLRFSDVTDKAGLGRGAWGMGVTSADFDNDGHADLYLTNLGPNVLYRNNGDGTFSDVTARAGVGDPRWSTSAAFGDYDADGFLDLFVPNYIEVGPDELPPADRQCHYRGIPCMCGPRGLPGAGDSLYHANGDGTFSESGEKTGVVDSARLYGLGSVWADVDDDGRLDLYVANDATPNLLFLNRGGGVFEELGFASGLAVGGDGQEQASMGVDFADYDNDGRLDAYCTHFAADYSTLYHNDGKLIFSDVTIAAHVQASEIPYVSWGTRFVDLDHDGWKDIFHANGHVYPFMEQHPAGEERFRLPHSLYLNRRDGTFLDASALAGPGIRQPTVGRGVAFADFDNDGDIDFAVAVMNGTPQLFRNDQAGRNHWVMFRTLGRSSNRDGIGARITVTAGGLSQVWEVKRTVGIYSCSDPRAHFGLGAAAGIDLVRVRWPSGKVQEFRGVPGDRHYLIDETDGLSEERFAARGTR